MGLKGTEEEIANSGNETAELEKPKPHKKSESQKRKERKERKKLSEQNAQKEETKSAIEEEIPKIEEITIETASPMEIDEENDSQDEEEKKKKLLWWPAMTNSPSILNKLLKNLCGIKEYEFSDIFTFEEDYLKSLSSKKTLGVFFCLPIFEKVNLKKIKN